MGLQDSMNDKNRKAMWVSVDYFCTQLCSIRNMLVVDLFSHKQFEWCTFKRKRYWKKSVDENEKLLGNKWSLVSLLHDNSAAGCFNSIEFHLSWYEFFFFIFFLTNKVPVFELPTCKLPIDILLHNQSIALYSIYPYWYDADFRGIITNFRVPVEKKRHGLLQFWCDSDMSNRQKKTHWLY